MPCDRQAVALRDGHSWRFQGNCRTAQKQLGVMLTKDFRAIDRRVLTALGIDSNTRKLRGNEILPGAGKTSVRTQDARIINRALAMELLVSTLLTCLDGPDEVQSLCTVSGQGEPNNFAPAGRLDIIARYEGFSVALEVSCKRDASSTSYFEGQLDQAVRHSPAAVVPGAGKVYALVVTDCSLETNLGTRKKYKAAVARVEELRGQAALGTQEGQAGPYPDVRLMPVKSAIFCAVCEEIFGAPGASGEGLQISSATLAKALEDAYVGLKDDHYLNATNWLYSTLVTSLREPAEEQLPI